MRSLRWIAVLLAMLAVAGSAEAQQPGDPAPIETDIAPDGTLQVDVGGVSAELRVGVPEIVAIVVAEDQTGLDGVFGIAAAAPAGGMPYPFVEKEGGSGPPEIVGPTQRHLLVIGRNLLDAADRPNVHSADGVSSDGGAAVTYAFLATVQRADAGNPSAGVTTPTIAMALRRAERQGYRLGSPYDFLMVRADLKPGVMAMSRDIVVAGATGSWPLRFSDATAKLRFVREIADAEYETVSEVAGGEHIHVEVELDAQMPYTRIPVRVGWPGRDQILVADKVTRPSRNLFEPAPRPGRLFRTARMFVRVGDGGDARRSCDAGIVIDMAEPRPILAAVHAGFGLPANTATVEVKPDGGGEFSDALRTAAACQGLTGYLEADERDIAGRPASRFSSIIVTEFRRRFTEVKVGDHAAMLLMKKELVTQLKAAKEAYDGIAADPMRFYAFTDRVLKSRGDPNEPLNKLPMRIWRQTEVTLERMMTMRDPVFQDSTFADLVQKNPRQAQGLLRPALDALSKAIQAAAERAESADDCDSKELMRLLGYGTKRIADTVAGRLMKKQSAAGGGFTWVPDRDGRHWVKGIEPRFDEVRAVRELSDVDTNVVATALAPFSLGTGWLLGSTAATVVALTTAPIGIGGAYENLRDQYRAREDVAFAIGETPVLGPERLADALARAPGFVETAATVVGAATEVIGPVADVAGWALRVYNGRKAARAVMAGATDTLTATERSDGMAFAANAQARRDAHGMEALDIEERAILRAIEERQGVSKPPHQMTPAERQAYNDQLADEAVERAIQRGERARDQDAAIPKGDTERIVRQPHEMTPAQRQADNDRRANAAVAAATGRRPDPDMDLLPGPKPVEPSAGPDFTAEEIARLHDPNRQLSQEELVRKAEYYRRQANAAPGAVAAVQPSSAPVDPGSTEVIPRVGPGPTRPPQPAGPGSTERVIPVGPGSTAPVSRTGPGSTAPLERTGPGSTEPLERTGPGATAPVTRAGPGATEPLERTGPGATEPLERTGPGSTEPLERTGPGSTEPVTRAGPGATEPLDRVRPGTTPPPPQPAAAARPVAAADETRPLPAGASTVTRRPQNAACGPVNPPGLPAAPAAAPAPARRAARDLDGQRGPATFQLDRNARLEVDKRLGQGTFHYVYDNDANKPGTVARVSRFEDDTLDRTPGSPTDRLEIEGRRGLEQADQSIVRPLKLHERYETVAGPDGKRRVVEIVERFPPNLKTLSFERLPNGAYKEQMTPGQAVALDRATRELNRRGFAWPDNHRGNYGFEPTGGTDEWKVVITDTGSVFPMRGNADEKARFAAILQRSLAEPASAREIGQRFWTQIDQTSALPSLGFTDKVAASIDAIRSEPDALALARLDGTPAEIEEAYQVYLNRRRGTSPLRRPIRARRFSGRARHRPVARPVERRRAA